MPDLPIDAELFAAAEALHDRSVVFCRAEWENGRRSPGPVCDPILNRWRLAFCGTVLLAVGLAGSLPPNWSEVATVEQVYGLLGLARALTLGHPKQTTAILDVSLAVCAREKPPRAGIRSTLAAAQALPEQLNLPVSAAIRNLAAAKAAAWIECHVPRLNSSLRYSVLRDI